MWVLKSMNLFYKNYLLRVYNDHDDTTILYKKIISRKIINIEDISGEDNIVNPLTTKLFNLNFHPLEVVDRVTQVSENYSDLTKWRSTLFKTWLMSFFYL